MKKSYQIVRFHQTIALKNMKEIMKRLISWKCSKICRFYRLKEFTLMRQCCFFWKSRCLRWNTKRTKNIFNKNSKLINRIRASRQAIMGITNKRERKSLMLINVRLVLKVINQIYEIIEHERLSDQPS